jgi:quinolinate synthase
MDHRELTARIKALLRERRGIWLAHNYQRPEIQDGADLTGDSLALSIAAAKTDAELILFCGVHFMAESAAILSPQKRVLLPRLDAGCPMANMIAAEQLVGAKRQRPGYSVVTYVNSTAAVKAESDICCTSANAVRVVEAAPSEKVFFAPDQNLAQWVAAQTKKKVEWWRGFCPTHHRLTAEHVRRAKERWPDAVVVVHPECRPEVTALADLVASTSGMLKWAQTASVKRALIGTEEGLLHGLRKANANIEYALIDEETLICPNMKLTTLPDVLAALERPADYTVTVPDDIRRRAKRALDRMLEVG